MSTSDAPHDIEWFADVPRSILRQTIAGLVLILVIVGGFASWAFTAPLAAAVIAPGSFVATGENKIVQHLEGGIIKALLVREGDQVTEGQDLVQLDTTAALANSRQLTLRSLRLQATLARLTAESKGLEAYAPPEAVASGLADPEIKAINDSQVDNFDSAKKKLQSQIAVLQESITALGFQHDGGVAQIEAMQRQEKLLEQEFADKSLLLEKGLIARSMVSAVERAMIEAQGEVERLRADNAGIEAQIDKLQKQIAQTTNEAQQVAADEMQGVEADYDTVREQMRQAGDVLGRTTIKAPVSGTNVRLYYHTAGGVIESGKAIMEILPTDVPLIIEAQIPRTSIDQVKKGARATVRLTALNQRITPVLDGEVAYVSADAITGANGKDDVYIARVSITPSQLSRVKGFTPTPGMPAEILIETHERTFFEYLTKPIADSMARAFREY
jgi:HlyD family secretion protein